jgi:5,10-methylenetetrahydrofolate reductase
MIDEVRSFGSGPLFQGYPDFKIGTVAKINRPLNWRSRADFIFVQISYSLDRLVRWREALDFDGKIYAGVLVLASSRMARSVNASIPEIRIPGALIDKLEDDPQIGVEIACEQIASIKESGAFDGVHLVPVGRYREVAARLRSGS